MTATGHIARHAAIDAIRHKVLYAGGALALVLVGVAPLLADLSAGQDVKIVKDLALAATRWLGLFVVVFAGIGFVTRGTGHRGFDLVLARPVRRHQIVLGAYGGGVLALTLAIGIVVVACYAVLAVMAALAPEALRQAWAAPAVDAALLAAFLLVWGELLLVLALAVFFSTFCSAPVATTATLGLWVAGHFVSDLRAVDDVTSSTVVTTIARALSYLLPDLAAFDIGAQVVHGVAVDATYVALTLVYGGFFVSALLVAGCGILARRDLL